MSSAGKYQIRIKKSAEREMDSLPSQVFSRISGEILKLEHTPRPRGCKKLRGRHEYRIRVGAYRVLYIVNDMSRMLDIVAVGHRRDVYR
jgi:mRNA interferase RelE/StbE